MKTIVALFLALAICATIKGFEEGAWDSIRILSVYCDTEEKLNFILQFETRPGYVVLKVPKDRSEAVTVYTTIDRLESFERVLTENGIAYKVSDRDYAENVKESLKLNEIARKSCKGDIVADLCTFPRYDEIVAYLKTLARAHSEVGIKLLVIGKSFEGRDVIAFKISKDDENSEKPGVLVEAGIHADEWITHTTVLYAVNQLVKNSTNRYLLEDVDVYVVPSLNPDGYAYSHKDASTRLWRKTRSTNCNSSCVGVDLNRNFGYAWRSFHDRCGIFYSGSQPFSEPEAFALRNFMLDRRNRIKVYISLHSFGNYILHPWSDKEVPPKSAKKHMCVGEKAKTAIAKIRGTRFEVKSSYDLYPVYGCSIDWAYGVAGVELPYLIELPSEKYYSVAPPSEIIPVGQEMFEAFRVFIQYATDTACDEM